MEGKQKQRSGLGGLSEPASPGAIGEKWRSSTVAGRISNSEEKVNNSQMKWRKPKDCAVVSACGNYSVARYGSASGTFDYVAWRTRAHPEGRHWLSLHPTADAAKKACEDDHAAA